MKYIMTIAVCTALAGCFTPQTYKFTAQSAAVNVPERIRGEWTYVIDDSIRDAKRFSFKPSGHVCSLHTYSLDASDALETTIRKAMLEFAESSSERKGTSGSSATEVVWKLDSFQPRFSCAVGQIEGSCTGTVEVALSVTVVKGGSRRTFSVSSERSGDAGSGKLCNNALAAPADAARKAIKDVVERALERMTNLARS